MKAYKFLKLFQTAGLVVFLASLSIFPETNEKGSTAGRPRLLIMPPVDLEVMKTDPGQGMAIRRMFSRSGKWQVVSRQEMESSYRQAQRDIAAPCIGSGCALSAAEMMEADFCLFGSTKENGRELVYDFKLVEVATGKVVWSQLGDALIKQDGGRLSFLLDELSRSINDMAVTFLASTEIRR